MAILNKGHDFSDGEQVTSTKLDAAIDSATFTSQAVDNVSTQLSGGAIIVKDGGITTAKIADSNVTKGKIENVANMKVLGNTSGSSAAPQEVSVLDEDDMASNSNTAIPTQQSVKTFVENSIETDKSSASGLVPKGEQGSLVLGSGLIIKFGVIDVSPSAFTSVTFSDSSGSASPFPNGIYGVNVTVNENISSSSETCSANGLTVNGFNVTGYRGTSGSSVGRCFFVAYGF
jgi:hypothetical protein